MKIGGGHFVVIAGPCAVESELQALTIARAVQAAGAQIFRGGAFKPRTSPYSYQGLEEDGLKILATVRAETGLPVITEAIDHASLDLVEEYADLIQIGARNMQNFSLLRRAGQARKPVLLKRGMSATLDEFFMAAEYILSEGNTQLILCERGVRGIGSHARNTLDLAAIPFVKRESHLPIIADPSHAAGPAPAGGAPGPGGGGGGSRRPHDRSAPRPGPRPLGRPPVPVSGPVRCPDGGPPDSAARTVVMREIAVPLPGRDRSYRIVLGAGLRQQLGDYLAQVLPGRRLWVVSDTLVGRLYGQEMVDHLNHQGVQATMLTVARGERSKSWPVVARLTQQLLTQGADRGSALVALGGGVVGDLTGFLAAVFMRGIPVIQVPTTLLAMVDAAIGGKTAINIPAGKNLVGAFHQPRLVLIDPEFLLTLPARERRNGLAEVVKAGFIRDAGLLELLAGPGRKLFRDRSYGTGSCWPGSSAGPRPSRPTSWPRMNGKGMCGGFLNFGHTLGHALEKASHFKLKHGEAVALGMVAALDFSVQLTGLSASEAREGREVLASLGLPVRPAAVAQRRDPGGFKGGQEEARGAAGFRPAEKAGGGGGVSGSASGHDCPVVGALTAGGNGKGLQREDVKGKKHGDGKAKMMNPNTPNNYDSDLPSQTHRLGQETERPGSGGGGRALSPGSAGVGAVFPYLGPLLVPRE